VPLPIGDASAPDPSLPGGYGWVAAGFVLVLGAIGTFWNAIRGGRREDSTTALTHANNIIRGYERYVGKQDDRIGGLEKQIRDLSADHRKENDALWEKLGETERKELRCQMRLEWLIGQMRSSGMDVPPAPFGEGTEDKK
jgi:hypothetical protein